jgi:hypothetical protein
LLGDVDLLGDRNAAYRACRKRMLDRSRKKAETARCHGSGDTTHGIPQILSSAASAADVISRDESGG